MSTIPVMLFDTSDAEHMAQLKVLMTGKGTALMGVDDVKALGRSHTEAETGWKKQRKTTRHTVNHLRKQKLLS